MLFLLVAPEAEAPPSPRVASRASRACARASPEESSPAVRAIPSTAKKIWRKEKKEEAAPLGRLGLCVCGRGEGEERRFETSPAALPLTSACFLWMRSTGTSGTFPSAVITLTTWASTCCDRKGFSPEGESTMATTGPSMLGGSSSDGGRRGR
jgi:hypothetical protein